MQIGKKVDEHPLIALADALSVLLRESYTLRGKHITFDLGREGRVIRLTLHVEQDACSECGHIR